MTVIAYRDGVLAADSLVTWRAHRDGHVRKIFKVGRILATASGTTALAQAFRRKLGKTLASEKNCRNRPT